MISPLAPTHVATVPHPRPYPLTKLGVACQTFTDSVHSSADLDIKNYLKNIFFDRLQLIALKSQNFKYKKMTKIKIMTK